MTREDAIKYIEQCAFIDDEVKDMAINTIRAIDQVNWECAIAISQLKELGLGLGEKVDKVKDALEKQIPKKPNKHEEDILGEYYSCPNCINNELDDIFDNYCPRCGQALDWSEENDDVYR